MRKIPLHIDQANPPTQQALRTLDELLPKALSVGSQGIEIWVSYPEWFGEAKAREAVRTALASAGMRDIALADSG